MIQSAILLFPVPLVPTIRLSEGSLPNTEAAAREIFSLPMFPTLTNEEVERVANAIKKIL